MAPPKVLVTGASGYIASWVAYAAQHLGYQVRGTVRSLKNADKIRHLREMNPAAKYPIELVEADLTRDDGWAAAVDGMDYILHVASPFPIDEPSDPETVIRPAVDGTLRILRAAANASLPPKRIVLTSSSVAVMNGQEKTVYTDNDWSDIASTKYPLNSYSKSKTLAEKAAWDFLATLPPSQRFELAVINPTFVLGPMLSSNDCSSASLMKELLLGKLPAIPNLQFHYVSVFDVASAHLLAMTIPEAAGKRFVLCSGEIGFPQIAQLISQEFRQYGYSPTSFQAPKFVISLLAFFGDAKARGIVNQIGRRLNLQSNNARQILQLPLREDHKLFIEIVRAAISVGYIPDKSRDQILSKQYIRPNFDLSMIPRAREN